MARAIDYKVPPPPPRDTAREEMDLLIQNLHEQGILRLANDIVCSYPKLLEILLGGLNREQSQSAIQNLALLAISLGQIPPERLVLFTRGITAAIEEMEQSAHPEHRQDAPGLTGALRMLHDKELWEGLRPALAGMRAFADSLHEAPAKPTEKRDADSDEPGSVSP